MRIATLALFSLTLMALCGPAASQERSQVPEKYTWNLKDLYPSKGDWKKAKRKVAEKIPSLGAHRGRMGDSAQSLYGALSEVFETKKEVVRLFVYAMQLADQDKRVAENTALVQEAEQLQNDFLTATSFLEPEVLSIGESKVGSFVSSEKRLKDYSPYLDNILRMKAHKRSQEVEKAIAQTGILRSNPDTSYEIFSDAEFPHPQVTLSGGEKVTLDPSAFAKFRASSSREERDLVFKAFFSAHGSFRETVASMLYGHVAGHIFVRDVRGYGSCLESALDENAIPTSVYSRLISDVHENLPTLHRYLKLRKRMMGLDTLRYQDLYAPTAKSVDMKFTPEEAMELTLKAFQPLGQGYVDTLKKGYESRWVDWMPSAGKRSGAYSEGAAYDVHPYQLLNFNGRYTDVSTLAHESGHSMHYHLSNRGQPFVTSEHATFVAEVASTLNESLLFRYMLGGAKDDATRLFLLNQRLESFRQTLFRQTLFAEFELRLHEMAEKGEPFTGESLSKTYLELLRTYYGHAAGVCQVDDFCSSEWTYIHHFWAYNFYVYQYATSLTASSALSKAIRDEGAGTKTRDAYIKMLSSGNSKYPIDLLKDAGVDMTTSVPFKASMAEMNEIMDQMEALLSKR